MRLDHRPLLTFAFVSDALAQSHDLLTGLIPLFKPLLAEEHGKIFDPLKLAARVQDSYGLDVSDDVIAELTPRFVTAGLIRRADPNKVADMYICEVPEKTEEEIERDLEVSALIQHAVSEFRSFINSLIILVPQDYSDNELEEFLVEWLVNEEFIKLGCGLNLSIAE